MKLFPEDEWMIEWLLTEIWRLEEKGLQFNTDFFFKSKETNYIEIKVYRIKTFMHATKFPKCISEFIPHWKTYLLQENFEIYVPLIVPEVILFCQDGISW